MFLTDLKGVKVPKVPKNVLDWVNEGRKILGLNAIDDLPRGAPVSALECPVARALQSPHFRAYVGRFDALFVRRISTPNTFNTIKIPLPDYVEEFITRVDEGKYPEYLLLF